MQSVKVPHFCFARHSAKLQPPNCCCFVSVVAAAVAATFRSSAQRIRPVLCLSWLLLPSSCVWISFLTSRQFPVPKFSVCSQLPVCRLPVACCWLPSAIATNTNWFCWFGSQVSPLPTAMPPCPVDLASKPFTPLCTFYSSGSAQRVFCLGHVKKYPPVSASSPSVALLLSLFFFFCFVFAASQHAWFWPC